MIGNLDPLVVPEALRIVMARKGKTMVTVPPEGQDQVDSVEGDREEEEEEVEAEVAKKGERVK